MAVGSQRMGIDVRTQAFGAAKGSAKDAADAGDRTGTYAWPGGVALRPTDHHRCAQVRGYIDSVLWIDTEPLGHHLASGDEHVGFYGFANVTKGVASFANVTHLGAECFARWGGAEQWRCLFGEYRLPLVRTPYQRWGIRALGQLARLAHHCAQGP